MMHARWRDDATHTAVCGVAVVAAEYMWADKDPMVVPKGVDCSLCLKRAVEQTNLAGQALEVQPATEATGSAIRWGTFTVPEQARTLTVNDHDRVILRIDDAGTMMTVTDRSTPEQFETLTLIQRRVLVARLRSIATMIEEQQ